MVTFLKLVGKEQDRFSKHGFDASHAIKMLDFIDDWLASHICRIDVQLREAIDGA
jgi:hemerythrin